MANSTDFDIDPFKETIYAEPSQSISSHSPPREPSPPNEAGPSSSSPTRRGSLQPTSSSPTTNFVHAYQVEHRPNPVSPSSSINNPKSPIPPIAAVTTPGRGGRPTLRDLKDVEEIKVMDAIKTSEGGSSSYIAYVIQSSTKEDPVTVARRKRMLAVFLNRLIRHPVLGRERVLWQFLAQDVSWSEVLQQPPLTNLPKNPMKALPIIPRILSFRRSSPIFPSRLPRLYLSKILINASKIRKSSPKSSPLILLIVSRKLIVVS
ncbi:Sorting nexin, cytoplasm-to-vacuole targeting pathway/endosomal sorting [Puccinia graminis f. sp. tritici]|uniref:Sorting nexin, cytoplasm-to-vacuole targeting pathway/endosomal sorting n=1 Tax=Puccinia graminis f. sp. tritici TaxID=56615 RepID=A0A5B0N409_PUCGR|nr:Sorting nexin, cytoplasm-to-vacuole targeting pathway/endosomal sorting [Puccinia graminis f. sp. tritici]